MTKIELLSNDPRLGRYTGEGGVEWPAVDINGKPFDRRFNPVTATRAVGRDRFVVLPRGFQGEVTLKESSSDALPPAFPAGGTLKQKSRGSDSNADE